MEGILLQIDLSSVGSLFADWAPFSLISLTITLLIAAIAFMIAEFVQSAHLKAWANDQFKEFGKLAALFICFSVLLFILNVLVVSMIPVDYGSVGDIDTYFNTAQVLSDSALGTCASDKTDMAGMAGYKGLFCSLVYADFKIMKLTSFNYMGTWGIGYYTWYGGKSPNAGMSLLNTAVSTGLQNIARAINILMIQKVLLDFFKTVFALIFPLGLFLRFFKPTSKIGGTILAVAIGIFLIYPVGMIMERKLMENYFTNPSAGISNAAAPYNMEKVVQRIYSIPDPGIPPGYNTLCNPAMSMFIMVGEQNWYLMICPPVCSAICSGPHYAVCMKTCMPTCQKSVYSWYTWVQSSFAYYSWYLPMKSWGEKNTQVYFDSLYGVLPQISQIALIPLVLAFLNIVFTILFIRSLATALGGEPMLPGLERVI